MLRFFLAVALVTLSVGAAGAQDAPGRVGRLSYIDGTVSLHLADQADWAPATVNFPVTSGEAFWTEPGGRAEIQIGPIELSIDQTTELDIVRLDDATIELQLVRGTLNLHLWQMPPGGISVVTPRGRMTPTVLGSYDIDVGQPSGDASADRMQVTVLEGGARFDGDRGFVTIGHSEAAVITGDPSTVTLAAAAYSPFDDWALARERREVAAQQPGYVAPTVTGYQDLNEYGSWSHDPTYGGVWYPASVPAGWAPYRYGHWAFVPPWGWTWIDDAPWGFTPFHYGRWIETGNRWGWVPGTLAARPVYAPALVAFIGGNGWGINLAVGSAMAAVGWVALAPNEVYHPYYRASQTYVRNVNITNVNRTVINNITVNNTTRVSNFRNRQSATVVPAAAFTRAAPVQRATVVVPAAQLAQASVAPSMSHLRPDPAARIGRAVSAAASAVPQPNAPATIARGRVAAVPPPTQATAPTPAAPGPPRDGAARRNATSPQAAAPAQRERQQPTIQAAPNAGAPVSHAQQPLPQAPPSAAVQQTPAPAAPPTVQQPTRPVAPRVAVTPPQASPPATAAPQAARQRAPPQPAPAAPRPIQVAHPEQQTHVAPTRQAWTRVPGPPPQPTPSQAAPAQPARARTPVAAAAPHPGPPSQPARAAPSSAKPPAGNEEHREQH